MNGLNDEREGMDRSRMIIAGSNKIPALHACLAGWKGTTAGKVGAGTGKVTVTFYAGPRLRTHEGTYGAERKFSHLHITKFEMKSSVFDTCFL